MFFVPMLPLLEICLGVTRHKLKAQRMMKKISDHLLVYFSTIKVESVDDLFLQRLSVAFFFFF